MKSKTFLTTCARVLNIGTAATLKETHFYLQKAFCGVSFPHGMPQSHSALQSHTGVFTGTTRVCPAAILLPCQMREAQVPGNEGFVRKAPRGAGESNSTTGCSACSSHVSAPGVTENNLLCGARAEGCVQHLYLGTIMQSQSLRLKKPSEISEANHQPSTITMVTIKPCPHMPPPRVL